MMVFPSLRLIVVVEDGGSLVLWKVLAAARLASVESGFRASRPVPGEIALLPRTRDLVQR